MAIERESGKPDFFIAVTCNPQWPEIKNEVQNRSLPHAHYLMI